MDADFVRYRHELGEEKIAAFEAFCFHRADEVAKPYTALTNAPLTQATADAVVRRVFDAAKGNYDTRLLCDALADALEGPGVMPGLVEVRGETGDYLVYSRNIYEERGAPFTLENLLAPVHYGLSSDPEFWFENVRGSETDVLVTCMHLTKRGLEFCVACFPERVRTLAAAEAARNR